MSTPKSPHTVPVSPAPAASPALRLPRGVVLGFMLLTSFGTGIVLSILGPTVPAIALHLRVPESALGLIFTANFLAATTMTAITGALFARLGGRKTVPVGLALMAGGLVQEGTAGTLPLVAMGAILAGLGTGFINVSVNTVAARLYPERRGSVLTWLNVTFGAGAFFTPLAAGIALTRFGGYAPVYLAGAGLLVVPILPLLVGLPAASSTADTASVAASGRALLRDHTLRLLMALAALYLGAEIGFGGWVVAIVAAMSHLAPAQLAVAASAFWVCIAAGGGPTVLLLRRGVTPRRLIILGGVAATVGVLVLWATGHWLAPAVICCALIGLALAPVLPLTTALATRRDPEGASDSMRVAAIFTVGQLGGAFFPALQGALLGLGPAQALWLTAACTLGIAALARAISPETAPALD